MTYTVVWSLFALLEVARVEAEAADSSAVRSAGARIDYALRRHPRDMGESR